MSKKIITTAALAVGAAAIALAPQASADAGYNQDTVSKFVAVVNAESSRYGTGYVPVYVDYLDDDRAIAASDGYSITLSPTYAQMTPEEFDAAEAVDVAAGYHPGGCNGIATVAIHEMGHVIDRATGRVATATVNAYSGQLGAMHGYAYESAGEAVAVSFQAVECGTATPTERSINDVLMNSRYVG